MSKQTISFIDMATGESFAMKCQDFNHIQTTTHKRNKNGGWPEYSYISFIAASSNSNHIFKLPIDYDVDELRNHIFDATNAYNSNESVTILLNETRQNWQKNNY